MTPTFLQKIDKQLLLNHPTIWATRIHHLLFWGGLYACGMYLLATFYPTSTQNIPDINAIFPISLLCGFLVFLYWAYQVSLYRPQEQFGVLPKAYSIKELGIYMMGILLLASTSVVSIKILSDKNASVISNSQLVSDINALNLGRYYIKDACSIGEYGHTIRNSLLFKDLLTYDKIHRDFEYLLSKEAELKRISDYINVFNRYSRNPIVESSEEILANYHSSENIIGSKFYKNNKNLAKTIDLIVAAKEQNTFFHHVYFYKSISIMLSFLTLAFLVFLRIGLRNSIITAIAGFILICVNILGFRYVNADAQVSVSGLLVEWFVCLGLALTLSQSNKTQIVKQVLLTLTCLGMPFIPLMARVLIKDHYVNNSNMLWMILMGLGITFIAWLGAYNPILLKNQAKPKIN